MRKPATKSKPAPEGGLKVEGCKSQVEKAGSSAGNKPSTFNLQPSTLPPRFPAWLGLWSMARRLSGAIHIVTPQAKLALLLALVTIALYWPAMRHDFINYDDDLYVTANVHVQNGLTLENFKWAFFNPVGLQLASLDGVVPYAGLPAFRVETVGTSSDQRVAPCPQHRAGFSAAAQPDRRGLAEPAGGGAVWGAPAACGIGGLGGGTQGCVERILWLLSLLFLRALRAKAVGSRKSKV